jgi:hypothetical protein
MRLRYQSALAIIAILILVMLFIGSSYALWKVTKYQNGVNVVETGCFSLAFSEQSSSINLTNAYPISDEKGLKTTPYVFTLTNTCTVEAEYNVYLNALKVLDTESKSIKIDDSLIRYSFGSTTTTTDTLSSATLNDDSSSYSNFDYKDDIASSYILASGTLKQNESIQYSLRLWIGEDATTDINNKIFEGVISTVAYAKSSSTSSN